MRILGWVKLIVPVGGRGKSAPVGSTWCGWCVMNPLGWCVGGRWEGEGGPTESKDEVGEGKCDMLELEDEALLEVESEGKGYSKGVLLVAKGVPTIWALGEWNSISDIMGAGMREDGGGVTREADEAGVEEELENWGVVQSELVAGLVGSWKGSTRPASEIKPGDLDLVRFLWSHYKTV